MVETYNFDLTGIVFLKTNKLYKKPITHKHNMQKTRFVAIVTHYVKQQISVSQTNCFYEAFNNFDQ